MKLFSELNENVKVVIEEAKDSGPKKYFIEGVFLQAVEPNRNKRIYSKEIMAEEVGRYTKEFIDKKRAFGELGHPEGPVVNLERVSHMIEHLVNEGNYWIGRAKVLDTPFGKIVKNFIDEGCGLGVSSRGMGTLVEQNGIKYVQNDFMLSTAADIVADPSSQKAFVQGIMEGKEWIYNNHTDSWMVAEDIKKEIKKLTAGQVALKEAAFFHRFLNSIK